MPKPVITFLFKVLRHGLLRDTPYTCPNLRYRSCSKCYCMDDDDDDDDDDNDNESDDDFHDAIAS